MKSGMAAEDISSVSKWRRMQMLSFLNAHVLAGEDNQQPRESEKITKSLLLVRWIMPNAN